MNSKKLEAYSPLILFVLILALWQGVCSLFSIPEFIFPSPLQIGQAMAEFAGPIAGAAWNAVHVPFKLQPMPTVFISMPKARYLKDGIIIRVFRERPVHRHQNWVRVIIIVGQLQPAPSIRLLRMV